MKVPGKLTKTEGILLLLGVLFLAGGAGLVLHKLRKRKQK